MLSNKLCTENQEEHSVFNYFWLLGTLWNKEKDKAERDMPEIKI